LRSAKRRAKDESESLHAREALRRTDFAAFLADFVLLAIVADIQCVIVALSMRRTSRRSSNQNTWGEERRQKKLKNGGKNQKKFGLRLLQQRTKIISQSIQKRSSSAFLPNQFSLVFLARFFASKYLCLKKNLSRIV
tara:strand:+ start:196 stop:606 length:411 start_codon:yes stop_codon:yes gene_type:complete